MRGEEIYMQTKKGNQNLKVESPAEYFSEALGAALEKRKLEVTPHTNLYLVQLLQFYLMTENLDTDSTLAESLLKAYQAERTTKLEMLKKLGDTSLYISGFFGDSLRRKIIDIDYYADIGGSAYAALASEYGHDVRAHVFSDISKRFLDYVDLLTCVSQSAQVQTNQDLLRLYERYVITGSELAKEQLLEKGIITNEQLKKTSNQ